MCKTKPSLTKWNKNMVTFAGKNKVELKQWLMVYASCMRVNRN